METSNSTVILSYQERLVVAVVYGLICISGTIGNCMIILAVSFSRKLQTHTNVFIVSLSVTDLLTSLSLMASIFALVGKDGWPLPNAEWFCTLSAFLLYLSVAVSLFNLAAIAVNRMVLITQQYVTYAKMYNKRNFVTMVATLWIVPILVMSTAFLLNGGGIGYDYEDTTCSDLDYHPNAMIYNLIQTVCCFIPSVVIIVSCYAKTFLYIRRHFKYQRNNTVATHMGTTSPSNTCDPEIYVTMRRKKLDHQDVQITRNLFLIVCLFFGCFSPYFVSALIPGARRASSFASFAILGNSAINPLVYGLKQPNFKDVLLKIITCRYWEIADPSDLLKRFIRKP